MNHRGLVGRDELDWGARGQWPRALFRLTTSRGAAGILVATRRTAPRNDGRLFGTPLARKLGIRSGARVAALKAPESFERDLGRLPSDVVLRSDLRGRGAFDVLVFFTERAAELERELPRLQARMEPDGGLWIAWPKQAAVKAQGLTSDLSGDVERELGLATGLVDNKVCAIDETWSGLRFVVRLKDRPGAARE